MLPKSSKVFNCEIVEDAKLVEREKYTFRCKNQTRYSRQRTSAKNSTRFSSDFRVRLAANAATQPENVRECRHETGATTYFYNKERRGLKRKHCAVRFRYASGGRGQRLSTSTSLLL